MSNGGKESQSNRRSVGDESFDSWLSAQTFGYLALAVLLTVAVQAFARQLHAQVIQPVANSLMHRKGPPGTKLVYHVQWGLFMFYLAEFFLTVTVIWLLSKYVFRTPVPQAAAAQQQTGTESSATQPTVETKQQVEPPAPTLFPANGVCWPQQCSRVQMVMLHGQPLPGPSFMTGGPTLQYLAPATQ